MTGFPLSPCNRFLWLLICSSILLLLGCSDSEEEVREGYNDTSRQCLSCHQVKLDAEHRFDCQDCHRDRDGESAFPDNHPDIVRQPSHPDNAPVICGGCHQQENHMVVDNDHYRLADHINLVRQAFGTEATEDEQYPLDSLSSYVNPETVHELADDLLSRRCLRCHVYSSGDRFSSVSHGTGCSACHLSFENGRMNSHQFMSKPLDGQCLSCHYANHVGYDFLGWYEHDLNEEYRTPYRADTGNQLPFGVEAHQLEQDVHQRAGLVCVDCHIKANVMGTGSNPQCLSCHQYSAEREPGPINPALEESIVVFTSSATGIKFAIPQMEHPAHLRFGDRFSCQACHARWTFNDAPTHLVRIDHEEFDDFYKLSLDGSSEVLRIISSHIFDDGDLLEPVMTNKFTGTVERGIWFKGYGERRWEQPLLMVDDSGVVTTGRPILDLRLSWIDEDEQARFDNLEPAAGVSRHRPYAAHTIGSAGLFYENRIRPFMESDEHLLSPLSKERGSEGG